MRVPLLVDPRDARCAALVLCPRRRLGRCGAGQLPRPGVRVRRGGLPAEVAPEPGQGTGLLPVPHGLSRHDVERVDARQLVWKAELPVMPLEAVVSMDGTLVTLDADADSGTDHAVVVYDGRGHVVRSWKLDDLVACDDAAKLEQSKSSPHWTQGAKYYFIRDKLYIALAFGKTIEIASSKDGRIKYGVAMPAVDNNAEAEVWSTSLRFSPRRSRTSSRKRRSSRPPTSRGTPIFGLRSLPSRHGHAPPGSSGLLKKSRARPDRRRQDERRRRTTAAVTRTRATSRGCLAKTPPFGTGRPAALRRRFSAPHDRGRGRPPPGEPT